MLHTIKELPNDTAIERNYLNCLLLEPTLLAQVTVTPKDFYKKQNGDIFSSMKTLFKDGYNVELSVLISSGVDHDYLMEIASDISSLSSFDSYETIIKNKSLYRGVIHSCQRMISMSQDEQDLSDIYKIHGKMADSAVAEAKDGINYIDAITQYLDNLGKEASSICKYGLKQVDGIMHGIKIGQLIVIAAGPGVGKTMFTVNIIEEIIKQDKKVAMFVLEMTDQEVVGRMVSKRSQMTTNELECKKVDRGMVEKSVTQNLSMKGTFRIFYQTSKFGQIMNQIRKLHVQQGLDVVVIDYLQLVRLTGLGRLSKNDQIGEITRGLKCLAQDLNIGIILLSQINRDGSKGGDPELRNLRDSGNIEQDANVVMFLASTKEEIRDAKEVRIIIAKNRNGETGIINVGMDPATMNVFNLKPKSKGLTETKYAAIAHK